MVPVRVSGTAVDDRALRSMLAFVVLSMLTFALGALGLAVDAAASGTSTGALTALGAAAACLGNVGPAFGDAGPFGSYAAFGDVSTGILTARMLLGRIEIIPLVVLFSRTYWRA